jgi:hypothetical protein
MDSSVRTELSCDCDCVKLPGADEQKTDLLGLIFRYLKSDDGGDWLMVQDNADDASVFFSQRDAEKPQMGDQMQHTTALSAYLPQKSRGSILVTSRSRDAAFRLGRRCVPESKRLRTTLIQQTDDSVMTGHRGREVTSSLMTHCAIEREKAEV